MSVDRSYDVLVVGSGPAGLAAAWAAARRSDRVGLIDDNPEAGGQIWRRGPGVAGPRQAQRWLRRVERAGVEVLSPLEIIASLGSGRLLGQSGDTDWRLQYRALILATGAQELFLPFPGWTLPGVVGAGGIQALTKGGLPVEGKRIIVAGSGPLLLVVGDFLKRRGADVRLIAEQASRSALVAFGVGLLRHPAKLFQAAALKARLRGVPYRAGSWPVEAHGSGWLESVRVRSGRLEWDEACDYLACGFGLVPRTRLAAHLGCAVERGGVRVDPWQSTTVEGVYCAGEPTGIGGLDLALVEGRIAGCSATGDERGARRLFRRRRLWKRFAARLESAFALREELRGLAAPETVFCRCEDISYGDVVAHPSSREAKLHTRCGMGACQGRICGSAGRFLFSWGDDAVRPPLFPARVDFLANSTSTSRSIKESIR